MDTSITQCHIMRHRVHRNHRVRREGFFFNKIKKKLSFGVFDVLVVFQMELHLCLDVRKSKKKNADDFGTGVGGGNRIEIEDWDIGNWERIPLWGYVSRKRRKVHDLWIGINIFIAVPCRGL